MKMKYSKRLIFLISLFIGIVSLTLISIMNNQYVNASTSEIQQPSFSTVTMNLFIEGIDGESKITGRLYSIDIIAYSHSISNPYDLATGQTTVKQHSPLRVVKEIDKATPKLLEKCLTGAGLPSVILKFYFEPNGLNFYTIELINAQVTSVQGYGTINADNRPMETVSFTYESIKWKYTEYDSLGNPEGTIECQDTWLEPPPG